MAGILHVLRDDRTAGRNGDPQNLLVRGALQIRIFVDGDIVAPTANVLNPLGVSGRS
ncbi:MAG TPA: hypothetical protein VNG13_13110 [Mycobacteriales bacterium]|nr:hypothetical protein [Mycobacteriales bacterium]